jgi:hypothetical protein
MTITQAYKRLVQGPIDAIDAAIFSGDLFHTQANLEDFRRIMARWERELKLTEACNEQSIGTDQDV